MGRKAFVIPIKRINIYLHENELARLDSLVGQHQRSKFIREAVQDKLDDLEQKKSRTDENTNAAIVKTR